MLTSFRQADTTRYLLKGLRIIPAPEDFDADLLSDQSWMDQFILGSVSSDLLFSVVFGKLDHRDVQTFSLHGGPIGLKIAALHVVDTAGYEHGPTFERAVGSRGSPLREAVAMLTGVGFIVSPCFSVQRVPTLKGRFLLDLARLLTYGRRNLSEWSDETKLILSHLKLDPRDGWQEDLRATRTPISDILVSVDFAHRQFGVDIMEKVSAKDPHFYSEFAASKFLSPAFRGATPSLWEDTDDVAQFGQE